MKTYNVKGLMIDRYDNASRFDMETSAVSDKKAVSNIRWRLMKNYGRTIMIRDVSVSCMKDDEINLFTEAM